MADHVLGRGVVARRLLALLTFAGLLALPATPVHVPATTGADPSIGVHVHAGWLDMDDAERAEVLDRLVDAGVDRVRIDVSWASLEYEGPDRIDPWWEARVARVLRDAASRGLHVLAVVWQTPPWASPSGDVSAVADDTADFGRFMAWFADRYGDDVDAYEVWNEPNEDTFFAGDADDYVALLTAATDGIRAGDPTADIVLGAPAYNDTDWLGAVYDAGAAGSFDVMATHPYLSPSDLPPEAVGDADDIWLMTHVDSVHRLMAAHGDGELPIWFTEFGWHTRPAEPGLPAWERGVTPAQQADHLVRAIALVARDHPEVTAMYWYNARDRVDSGPRNNSYGLLDRDLVPKPVYWALRARLTGITRIAGGDRIDTAVRAAALGWPLGASEVVVARSDLPSDAVVATPLAASVGAPILLTPRDHLDARTAASIRRLAPRRVTLVGGEHALAADVAAAVSALGVDVRRLAGPDRADTAAEVSRLVAGSGSVLVDGWATADDPVWADALVAGGVALADGGAVLFGRDPLPDSTASAVGDRGGTVTVVGTGPTATQRGLERRGLDDGVRAVRGDTSSATSEAALAAVPHDGAGPLLLATSGTFPDGLVGTALSHRLAGRVHLVDPAGGGADVTRVVDRRGWVVMGGPVALPDASLPG